MAKYGYEQKMEVVLAIIENKMSIAAVGKSIGASYTDAKKWLRLYEKFGTEGLVLKNGTYDGQFKIDVIEYMYANHLSITETAAHFGIPSKTPLMKWERIYYEEGREALFRDNRGKSKMTNGNKPRKSKLDKKVEEDLIAEVQRLRMENDYLKKLNALILEKEKSARGIKRK